MKKSDLFIGAEHLPWENVGEGVRRRILGYDAEIMMVCVNFEKGSVGSVHKHPHRQVTLVDEGSFEVQIGLERRVLKSGDSFFVPPDVEHGVVALERGTLIDVFTPAREDFLART
jgi:quercetin dioxygenase-like cupin family protein